MLKDEIEKKNYYKNEKQKLKSISKPVIRIIRLW